MLTPEEVKMRREFWWGVVCGFNEAELALDSSLPSDIQKTIREKYRSAEESFSYYSDFLRRIQNDVSEEND